MKKQIAILATAIGLFVPAINAQVYPLSENTWDNPDFVKRFLGSYGFDTNVTPTITTEERTMFETITPLIASDPLAAIQQIENVLLPETSSAVIYTLANLYLQSGNSGEAKKYYKQAIEKFPNFLRAYQNLGTAHIQDGNFEDATTMLLKAVELGARGADIYGLLGYAYLNLGNAPAALRSYEQALFFAPKSRDWRMGKVQALNNMGRFEDVISLIDQLVEEFPGQLDLLMLQANAFIARNDPEGAAATLELLRSKGAASATAMTLLGDIYLNFQQPDLALGAYRDVANDDTLTSDRALRIARRMASYAAWPQIDDFIKIIESQTSSKLSPNDKLDLLNLKAQADLAQNRNAEAAVKLAEVVLQDPLNGKALMLLADYHWKQDEIEMAEIYFERAAKVVDVKADAHLQHARMLVSKRQFNKAVDLLERAQMIKPQPHVAQFLERVVAASRAVGI